MGADLFIEYISDGGYTLGVNYVPMDVELGNGSRTDVSGDGSENDAGTRKAAADITDLITVYANVPVVRYTDHTTVEPNVVPSSKSLFAIDKVTF